MAQVNKIFIPTYISSIDYKPARVLPHVYFYNGTKVSDTFFIQGYVSGSKSSVKYEAIDRFPYFDNYNGNTPTTGSKSLLFNNEPTPYGSIPNESLYSEYWSKYVSLLYNPRTRLIDASAIIPLADYFKMELNDIVEWRGNYYHLRAINDYNLTNGECSLQLLGPILSDTIGAIFGGSCLFDFTSEIVGTTTTTTIAPTTTTTSTTTTAAPTTTTSTTTAGPTTTTTTLPGVYTIDYLVIAGGGGGGYSNNASARAGGGGAGGWISGSTSVSASFVYPAVIGAAGAGGQLSGEVQAQSGSVSSFVSQAPRGGGKGGSNYTTTAGGNGGSGGGACSAGTPGSGYSTQGFAGRTGGNSSGIFYGGGGGSAYQTPPTLGSSAIGKYWLDGNVYAAGGIGRGCSAPYPGNGSYGQGGSGGDDYGSYGNGGIVVLRYLGTPRGTGGTITQSGGYTYHTFTSSGTFTA